MSKNKSKDSPLTCKAVTAFKTDDFLTVAVEFTIEDGRVTSIKQLNAPNLPTSSIGTAQQKLWEYARTQYRPEEKAKVSE